MYNNLNMQGSTSLLTQHNADASWEHISVDIPQVDFVVYDMGTSGLASEGLQWDRWDSQLVVQ